MIILQPRPGGPRRAGPAWTRTAAGPRSLVATGPQGQPRNPLINSHLCGWCGLLRIRGGIRTLVLQRERLMLYPTELHLWRTQRGSNPRPPTRGRRSTSELGAHTRQTCHRRHTHLQSSACQASSRTRPAVDDRRLPGSGRLVQAPVARKRNLQASGTVLQFSDVSALSSARTPAYP